MSASLSDPIIMYVGRPDPVKRRRPGEPIPVTGGRQPWPPDTSYRSSRPAVLNTCIEHVPFLISESSALSWQPPPKPSSTTAPRQAPRWDRCSYFRVDCKADSEALFRHTLQVSSILFNKSFLLVYLIFLLSYFPYVYVIYIYIYIFYDFDVFLSFQYIPWIIGNIVS